MKKQENTNEFSVSLSLDIGDVILDVASIVELYFIEDIFSFCVTGKIIFTDQRGVFEFGPLTGNERINIIYGDEDDEEWTFDIYKVSSIDKTEDARGGTSQAIEMFFVDVMFFPLNHLQFSRSWKDKRASSIIFDIAENMLGVGRWEHKEIAKEKLDYFYMPYWTPYTAIKWLLQRCTSKNLNVPGYCLYNNSKGTNFVTLEKLLNGNLMEIGGDSVYVFSDSNPFLYNKILSWSISGIDSLSLKNLAGNTLYGYNSMTKSFITKEFGYAESVKNHTILGRQTLFPDYTEKRIGYKNTEETNINSIDTIYHNTWNKVYDHQQVLSIIVRGHERRYCGGMIEIEWPSKSDLDQRYNKNLSGYYLVKSITHHFSGYGMPHYKQKMLCIKNGYEYSDARNLEKATKTNIAT